jgi:ParB-like nuclease domain
MTPEMIRVALVYPSHTGRTPDPERLKALAASIKEIGLRTPITVRRATKVKDGRDIDAYEIVAGRHRYEAVRSLGAEEIACVVTDDDDLHAQLWEIDENLIRAELSPSERASCTARRKEIYEALHPEAKHGGDRKSGGSSRKVCDMKKPARFTADTAVKTGKSERSVQLDAARGERLRRIEAYQGQIVGTSLDKGAELDALTRLPVAEAKKLIASAANGEAISAIAAERARKQSSPRKPDTRVVAQEVADGRTVEQLGELKQRLELHVAATRGAAVDQRNAVARIRELAGELAAIVEANPEDEEIERASAKAIMAIYVAGRGFMSTNLAEALVVLTDREPAS